MQIMHYSYESLVLMVYNNRQPSNCDQDPHFEMKTRILL